MTRRGFIPILIVVIAVLIVAVAVYVVAKKQGVSPPSAAVPNQTSNVASSSSSYFLYKTTTGQIIGMEVVEGMVTGRKGQAVSFLKNPQYRATGGASVAFVGSDPIWENIPDGDYKTPTGETLVVAAGTIARFLDASGNDITPQ